MPVDTLDSGEGQHKITVPFISPKSFVRFLLEKAPELLTGGFTDEKLGRENLTSFWGCYQRVHPDHDMFREEGGEDKWSSTLAMSMHGDEGRGLKKTNTCVIMLESNLGLQTALTRKRRVDPAECPDCCVSEAFAKRCRTQTGFAPKNSSTPCSTSPARQVTNLRHNSFLTKFVLCALPDWVAKQPGVLATVLERFCSELRCLATEGVSVRGRRWYVQLTGLKGDLDWYKKIANLTRCYKQQLGPNLPAATSVRQGLLGCPSKMALTDLNGWNRRGSQDHGYKSHQSHNSCSASLCRNL